MHDKYFHSDFTEHDDHPLVNSTPPGPFGASPLFKGSQGAPAGGFIVDLKLSDYCFVKVFRFLI
jgi:hypothetical protein